MKKRIGLFLILGLVVFYLSNQVYAGEITNLRMGMIAPVDHPVDIASKYFGEIVERRTVGKIVITTYPGGVLGGETELVDMVTSGVLDMANIGVGGAYNPKLEAPCCLFYLFPSVDAMWDFYGSEPYKEELLRVQEQRNTVFLSMNWWQNWRHVIANKPIKSPKDFKGLTLRYAVVDPLKAKFYAALGAHGEPLELPEVYEALQRGIVDGFECPLDWIYTMKAYEVVKHLTLTSHITYLNSPIINKTLWEKKLTPVQREVILTAAREAGEYQNQLQKEREEQILQEMKQKGVQVYTFSDKDMQELVSLCKEVQIKWAEEKGIKDWLLEIINIMEAGVKARSRSK